MPQIPATSIPGYLGALLLLGGILLILGGLGIVKVGAVAIEPGPSALGFGVVFVALGAVLILIEIFVLPAEPATPVPTAVALSPPTVTPSPAIGTPILPTKTRTSEPPTGSPTSEPTHTPIPQITDTPVALPGTPTLQPATDRPSLSATAVPTNVTSPPEIPVVVTPVANGNWTSDIVQGLRLSVTKVALDGRGTHVQLCMTIENNSTNPGWIALNAFTVNDGFQNYQADPYKGTWPVSVNLPPGGNYSGCIILSEPVRQEASTLSVRANVFLEGINNFIPVYLDGLPVPQK